MATPDKRRRDLDPELEFLVVDDFLRDLIGARALPKGDGWVETPARPLGDLNDLPSPCAMDLVPKGGLIVLQTYRGCPFTCSFCEWGALEVDAGLNLNQNAFRNLRAAADMTGFFATRSLICEVYPAKVRQEHIDFLASIHEPLVGIGLQSFDNEVLKHVERSFDEARFETTLHQLREVAHVAIEIIMGLPGDTPENFRKSFERARSLPTALRVYHCVVLPSALMVRAPASDQLDYDPITLKMRSCLGWSERELQTEMDYVTACAARDGGRAGEFFWVFPPPHLSRR